MNWMLGVLSGVAGTLLLVIVIAIITKKYYHQPIQYAGTVTLKLRVYIHYFSQTAQFYHRLVPSIIYKCVYYFVCVCAQPNFF